MRQLLFTTLLVCFCSTTTQAYEPPLRPKCEVEAKILSISTGKLHWGDNEFFLYSDIGILITKIKPLKKSKELSTCSRLKGKTRTEIVRLWHWNNEKIAWTYKNGTTMKQNDSVKLELTHSYVDAGSWPTIIDAKLLAPSNKK